MHLSKLALLLPSLLLSQPALPQTPSVSHPIVMNQTSVIPLYSGPIPNSTNAPDQERFVDTGSIEKISRPTLAPYIPSPAKAMHTAVLIFPGGGYAMEVYDREGTRIAEEFQDRGIAAFVVKYRLPSDVTMPDKSIGPLQDAQQAIRLVRQNAAQWNIDPNEVGVLGFSAGGHLASTVGTHFDKDYAPNPDHVNLRPDFLILVYPVISMTTGLAHAGSRKALLGPDPNDQQVHLFSNEEQVTAKTPPTLLLHAGDDTVVDVDNSVRFYESLRNQHVPAEMLLFPTGGHGFPTLPFDEWFQPILHWMTRNGWQRP